jgi:hypothetical protein
VGADGLGRGAAKTSLKMFDGGSNGEYRFVLVHSEAPGVAGSEIRHQSTCSLAAKSVAVDLQPEVGQVGEAAATRLCSWRNWINRSMGEAQAGLDSPVRSSGSVSSRLALALAGLLALDLGLLLLLFAPRQDVRGIIDTTHAVHVAGFSYQVGLQPRTRFLYALPADSQFGNRSTLELYENSVPIGPGHMVHQDIIDLGGGRYSHWSAGGQQAVYFSSSDGTDPRTNGREYAYASSAQVVPRVRTGVWLSLSLQLAFALLWLIQRRRRVTDRRSGRGMFNQAVLSSETGRYGVAGSELALSGSGPNVRLLIVASILCAYGLGMVTAGPIPGSVLAASSVILSTALLAHRFGAFAISRWPDATPVVFRLLALIVPLLGSRAASELRSWPTFSLAFLAAGVAESIALWNCTRPERTSALRPAGAPSGHVRLGVSAGVFFVAMIASYLFRASLSTAISPDTASYWMTPRDLIKSMPGVDPFRTPFYSFLFVAVQLFGGTGSAVLVAQFAFRAVGAALVAWLLTRTSALAGTVVGTMLALDPVSAATSTAYLTESAYTSALVISLVVVVAQLAGSPERRPWRLLIAGAWFGGAFLIRPISAALICLVVPAYAIITRSLTRSACVAGGYALVAVLVAAFNYARTGLFVIVTTGLYVAFPLFVQHLMDAQNGHSSETIYRQLEECDPGLDYSTVSAGTANEFVYTKLLPCTIRFNGGDRTAAYRLYASAYREALLAHPGVFAWRLLLESSRFLGTPVSYYAAEATGFARLANLDDVCARRPPYENYPSGLIAFVCPMPAGRHGWRDAIAGAGVRLMMVYQPYFYAYDPLESTPSPELAGAAGVLFFLLAFVLARPAYRPMIFGATVIILYNAAMTAFGQVTMTRYVAPVSPFFLMISGLLTASLIEELLQSESSGVHLPGRG